MSSLEQDQLDTNNSADRFWRSIDELAQTPEVLARLQQEFPDANAQTLAGLSRRQFTQLMAASLALAGATFTGCRRWPEQAIRPQSSRTEGFFPGVAEYFATQFELGGVATGILAKSVDGRPIKIEGNELHPFSKGAAGVLAQASILELYDPDRTRGYIFRPGNAPQSGKANVENSTSAAGNSTKQPAELQSREAFKNKMQPHFAAMLQRRGRGLHVLAQANSSPTFARIRNQFQTAFPEARWHVYEPLDRDYEFAGSMLAFNRVVRCQYQLQNAATIVCLDADLLGTHPGHQKWCRDWAAGRNPNSKSYSRLWAFESGYSITGAAADIRQPLLPSEMPKLVRAIAAGVGLPTPAVELNSGLQNRVSQLVNELKSFASRSLMVAGPSQPPEVHAWVHAINQHLDSFGHTVSFTAEPLAEKNNGTAAFAELCGALRGRSVDTLLILGGNPVYDGPADLNLDLQSNPNSPLTSIYLGLFDNETAQQCTWHIPAAHYLEAWGDGRAWDGTYSVQQPLIHPLFDGISAIEFLSWAHGKAVQNGLELVRETARGEFGVAGENTWQQLLHDGVLPGSQYADVEIPGVVLPPPGGAEVATGFEICFTAGSSTFDGRFANNGWLQELPDPLTKLTWDNAALISKQDADHHQLADGDEIAIEIDADHKLAGIPVLIQPGQMPGTISLSLGYGRRTGHIASDVGTDVFPIRPSTHRYSIGGASISPTGQRRELACTQEHHLVDPVGMAGRRVRVGQRAKPGTLIRETTLPRHQHDPHEVHAAFHSPPAAPMFDAPDKFNSPSAWGMSIDLNTCVGCNACVVACQSENNIPIVGKVNVLKNREMHWMRIDRYFKGDVAAPDVVHVPMACAHCEDAPCEQVCPVAATVHDTEGLNAMVYNRCVGTRYCANNCPYKVRRFNYFDFHASDPKAPAQPWLKIPDEETAQEVPELVQLAFNPEVSVRMRGVMEKCTYCVQRISAARIAARNAHAKGKRANAGLNDGEVVTACQQACPTNAIQFGDLNDQNSNVSIAQHDPRAYAMLGELNIKPRTMFLARIRNIDADVAATNERLPDHGHD